MDSDEVSDATVAELATAITDLVARVDASITIRSDDGKFLYVNEAWERSFRLSLNEVKGKTLSELSIMTPAEVALSDITDDLLRRQKTIVETVTYGTTTRLIVIRSLMKYKRDYYRIVIAFNSQMSYLVSTPLGWDPSRADRVYGELIALRLKLLESTSQFS